nr:hypothetical protein [Tanacetum cinerariifolium]
MSLCWSFSISVSCECSILDSASKISSLLFQRVIDRLDAISSSSSSSKSTTSCFPVLFYLLLASRGSLACYTLNCGCDDGCAKFCGYDGCCEKYCGCEDCCEKILVAYFLDSCNFGSRIVDFDDTPIVSDKLDRGVTFTFQKGDTVATNLSFGNLREKDSVGSKKLSIVAGWS